LIGNIEAAYFSQNNTHFRSEGLNKKILRWQDVVKKQRARQKRAVVLRDERTGSEGLLGAISVSGLESEMQKTPGP
jgi:hypothetical protein